MPPLTADAERVVAWLSAVRFCEGLNCDELAVLASEIRLRPFVAGETLASAGDDVTDEAGAIEAVGQRPLLVPGSSQNFKVTYPDDFALAEAVLKTRSR